MLENSDLFDSLASGRRRKLLVDLLGDDPQTVPELSEESQEILDAHEALIREFLSGARETANTDKDSLRLYHVHLPKLTEYGYVTWDRDAHSVSKGAAFGDAEALLEFVRDHEDESPEAEIVHQLRK